MSDLAAVLLAVAAAAGALVPRPLPLLLPALVVAGGLATRRPAVLCLGVALATSALAARSWAGLHPPVTGEWRGRATLATDPADVAGALRVDVRIGGRRVEAWARGPAAGRLRPLLAGETVELEGRIREVPPESRARLARRHVGARMTVTEVAGTGAGSALTRAGNRVRRTLVAGAATMPHEQRSLFTGFVLGDNRGQPPEVVHDFRASGLSHLLVVSGQNVAFVLLLARPALARLPRGARLAAAAALLAGFGTLTRWEPSVLRAVGMTGVALLATAVGRPASTVRLLALAVAGLLVIDPLLVGSLGFLLSVGATAGIALLAGPLARAVPGPRPLATVVAVTLAAQIGVAPVLVPVFGGIPTAALGANLLAGPVAGPLMVWGLSAGLPAGLLGPVPAWALHLPTRAMVGWIAWVARQAAALPLGRLGAVHGAVLLLAAGTAVLAARQGRRGLARAGVAAVAAVLVGPVIAAAGPVPGGTVVARGAELWRTPSAAVLVLDGARAAPDRLLDGLHASGTRRLDLVVATRGTRAEARLLHTVGRRVPVGRVVGPAGRTPAGGAHPVAPGTVLTAGDLRITVGDGGGGRLAVTVGRTPTPG